MPVEGHLARATDPPTSQAAADAACNDGTVDTHEWWMLQVLRWMPRGGTGSEIAAAIRERYGVPMLPHQVRRRFAAMLLRGQIFRRSGPDGEWVTRQGETMAETIHFFTRGDCPLFPGL